jgi:uncharacterized protein YdhG (YjbR/CyaY superfamily)
MKKAAAKRDSGKGVPAKTVDAYLAAVPPDVRAVLERLRKTVKSAAPKAEEVISYQMPAYKHHGMLVFFAAFKNHCSLFVASKALMKSLREDLKAYDVSGVTIHFTVDKPLPAALVRKIVKARIKENDLRFEKKNLQVQRNSRPMA